MNLFQSGFFTLRSGKQSQWKIECDSLTKEDWATLARMAADILPPFRWVSGVPRGGIPFGEALMKYVSDDEKLPILIAEDVCTTGGSMERHRVHCRGCLNRPNDTEFIGVCVFARERAWPKWIKPLFAFNPPAEWQVAALTDEEVLWAKDKIRKEK